jgi:hypothetical protein
MSRTPVLGLGAVACLLAATAVHGQTIVNENFESYPDTASMLAAWPGGPATLDTTNGNPGQAALHPGGVVNSRTFPAVNPTNAAPLVYTADIFDDGLSANKRMSAGLRHLTPAENLVEMGMYNAGVHYVFRVVLFASTDPISSGGQASYGKFDLGLDAAGADRNRPTAGWHRYQAIIGDTQITFNMDLFADGTIDASHTINATPTALGWNNIRFGGISGLSSPGGSAMFDNISLVLVPEPGSLSLLAMGGLALVRRRRI